MSASEITYTFDTPGIVLYSYLKCTDCGRVFNYDNICEMQELPRELVTARILRGDWIQWLRYSCPDCQRLRRETWFDKLIRRCFRIK